MSQLYANTITEGGQQGNQDELKKIETILQSGWKKEKKVDGWEEIGWKKPKKAEEPTKADA